jgi:hypothetical protein
MERGLISSRMFIVSDEIKSKVENGLKVGKLCFFLFYMTLFCNMALR